MRTVVFEHEPLFPQCTLRYHKDSGRLDCVTHQSLSADCSRLIARWPAITKTQLSSNLRVAQGTAAKLLLSEMNMAKRARSKRKINQLAHHWHRDIRWRAIHNRHCPPKALRYIAEHPETMRPYGALEVIAAHPNCPEDLLQKLLASNNQVIHQAAKRRYRKKYRFMP